MKIVACIKRVPSTETQPKISASGDRMERTGVEYLLSFYDDLAVEEAIRTKEKHDGEVTVLTLGPKEASKEVRDALAKGADRGVILIDDEWEQRDCLVTAKTLAAKIKEIGADLVLTGRVATDRDNAAVGPMLATLLDFACVTDVIELEIEGTTGKAKRETDAGIESYSFSLPAVVTCEKGLNEPRRPALKGIMAAKKKPLDEEPVEPVAGQVTVRNLGLPPARKEGRIVGEGAAAVPDLIEALRNEAQVL